MFAAHYAKPGMPLGFYRTNAGRAERLIHGLWCYDSTGTNSESAFAANVRDGVFTQTPAAPSCVAALATVLVPRSLLDAATAHRFDASDTFAWRKQIENATLRRVSLVRYEGKTHSVESSLFNGLSNIPQSEVSTASFSSESAARAAFDLRVTALIAEMGGAVSVRFGLAELLDEQKIKRSFEAGCIAEQVTNYAIKAEAEREAKEREERAREKQVQRELREREAREAAKLREREARAAAEQAERERVAAERAARGDVSELDDGALRALLRRRREEAKAKAKATKGDGTP